MRVRTVVVVLTHGYHPPVSSQRHSGGALPGARRVTDMTEGRTRPLPLTPPSLQRQGILRSVRTHQTPPLLERGIASTPSALGTENFLIELMISYLPGNIRKRRARGAGEYGGIPRRTPGLTVNYHRTQQELLGMSLRASVIRAEFFVRQQETR